MPESRKRRADMQSFSREGGEIIGAGSCFPPLFRGERKKEVRVKEKKFSASLLPVSNHFGKSD